MMTLFTMAVNYLFNLPMLVPSPTIQNCIAGIGHPDMMKLLSMPINMFSVFQILLADAVFFN